MKFHLSDYYIPTPKQRIFHENPAKYKCFMGGVGSGKTYALDWEALLLSLEFPGNYGLIGRLFYTELRDTTMHDFFEICPPELIQEYIKTEHKLVLKNGSTIIFRALEDVDKLKSLNLGFFGIDEMTEIPEDIFLILQSRLRLNRAERRVGFGSTNPEGLDWVYNKFTVKHKGDPDYLMVSASSYDNPHLPVGYQDDLIKSYPDFWVKRYVLGDPTAFAGQIIQSWSPRYHVIQPFDPPAEWARTVVLDHGTNNPTAVIWAAVHPENFIVIYREHYEAGQTVDYHSKKIHELNGPDNVQFWYADPAIFNRTLQDPKRGLYSIADLYAEEGMHFAPADNDVKTGIQLLIENFKIDDNLINPFTQERGSPKIFITSNCANTIAEIPQYRWKKLRFRSMKMNMPEEPEKKDDHLVDCIRYLLMSRPIPMKVKQGWKGFKTREERIWDRLDRKSKENKSMSKIVSIPEFDRSVEHWRPR